VPTHKAEISIVQIEIIIVGEVFWNNIFMIGSCIIWVHLVDSPITLNFKSQLAFIDEQL